MTEGPEDPWSHWKESEEGTIGEWLAEWQKEGMKPGDTRHFVDEYEATYLGMSPTEPSDSDASGK